MIQVSKEEMKLLRKRFPWIHATRTVHKYYVEESPKVLAFMKSTSGRKENGHA